VHDPLSGTYAYGINGLGDVVGKYEDRNGADHGFLYIGGSYKTLDVPGATDTEADGINDAGEIVGGYVAANGSEHGFLYSGGSYLTFDLPGAFHTAAYGINNAGQIVGEYGDANGRTHGFLATPTPEPSARLLFLISTVTVLGYPSWRRRCGTSAGPPYRPQSSQLRG